MAAKASPERDLTARDLATILLNAPLIQSHTRDREMAAAQGHQYASTRAHDAAWAAYTELVDAVVRIAKRNGNDYFDLLEIRDGLSTQTNAEDLEG